VVPNADAIVAATLLPAMCFGGELRIPEPISPRLLRMQREFQAIQRAWSLRWVPPNPRLEEVRLSAPAREQPPAPPTGRVAAFFSGGVDSWATLLTEEGITDLIFVRGTDLMLDSADHQRLVDEVQAVIAEVAGEVGKQLTVVETNLRSLSDPLTPWDTYFGTALAAVALFTQPLFDRVLISSEIDHEVQPAIGTARMVDQLLSTEGLEIVDVGGRHNRVERIRAIADHPLVQRTLRVCWENPDGAYNCGRCRKCLQTMTTLEVLGKRDRFPTFPPELDLEAIERVENVNDLSMALWEDVLDAVRAAGRADLERAVEPPLARRKQKLGLSAENRMRAEPGPPRLGPPAVVWRSPDEEREALLETVLNSRSWRLTAPLRAIAARLGRVRRSRT
jgi:hypothetical protein